MAGDPAPGRQGSRRTPRGAAKRGSSGMSDTGKAAVRKAVAAPLFSADDLHLFNEGTHYRLFEKLGAHALPAGGVAFAVWAPNAQYVSVVGDFNGWDRGRHPMRRI